ncbi:hypothetical protein KI387_033767 [Taxus chinensis]|uniref:Serine-threonine/tyrosine-protein kinase catalytic domain-containing protein n=1 Tax=Taxus chinensis TaxID=29808 RepID=A0AA38BSX3_TAXCH|nr:hypothetical protein KI387_033767 [Taxus chinensis]
MNQLYGRIPPEIGQCALLEDLHLCCNNLSSTIPLEVANLRNLNSFLDLSMNTLIGPVPLEIGGKKMLQVIDLSVLNKLSRSILTQITGLVGVQYLNLSHNHLTSLLPSAIRGFLPNGEKIAKKVFTDSNSKREERSFLRECKNLGKIWHRNLVNILTSCSTLKVKVVVLPFMANESLDKNYACRERSCQNLTFSNRALFVENTSSE